MTQQCQYRIVVECRSGVLRHTSHHNVQNGPKSYPPPGCQSDTILDFFAKSKRQTSNKILLSVGVKYSVRN